MFIFLTIITSIIGYLVIAGATHGYAKHRWPVELVREYQDYGNYENLDKNRFKKFFCAVLWPLYWMFIWTFTKSKEVTFSHIEKHAAQRVTKNKIRISDLHATREQVEASNKELEQAEADLEKEITRTL